MCAHPDCRDLSRAICARRANNARKIRAARLYMRSFMRPSIKACMANTPSVPSVYSACLCVSARGQVVKDYSCGFVSIRGSKDS